jgi:homoserine O-acetyltransferase
MINNGSRAAKRLLILAAFCLCARPLAARELKFASLGDFHLESGKVIRNLQLGYRTFGNLNTQKSNAVLIPSWFTSSTDELAQWIGSGKLVDTSRYYVIAVDSLGDGIASSPSNSQTQPGMQFPEFTIRDLVNSQYALLTRTLDLRHIHAVIGTSMAGMETFQWMVSYPGFMDEAIPIVGSPRLTSYGLMLWTTEIHAIEADQNWNHGDYASPPVAGLKAAVDVHSMNLTSPGYRIRRTSREEFATFLDTMEKRDIKHFDANNRIRQIQAMMSQNVTRPYGGSMEKAAAVVRARVLVIIDTQDHMVNPGPALAFAKLIHARVFKLTSDCGHLVFACEWKKVNQQLNSFLAE